MKGFDEGFAQTIGTYARKADDVDAGRLKLLPDAPNHVPVLAKDLRYLCELAMAANALQGVRSAGFEVSPELARAVVGAKKTLVRPDAGEPSCEVCGARPASHRLVSEEDGIIYFCGACAPASLDP